MADLSSGDSPAPTAAVRCGALRGVARKVLPAAGLREVRGLEWASILARVCA